MNEYLVARYNPNMYPKLEVRRVMASDLASAISMSGYNQSEIISAKLNLDAQATV